MSVLSRLGASVGIGNLSVKVNVPSRICIGEPLQGTVVITGGNVEQTAQRLWVGIRLGWETEDEDRHTQRHYAVQWKQPYDFATAVSPGQVHQIPFGFNVPTSLELARKDHWHELFAEVDIVSAVDVTGSAYLQVFPAQPMGALLQAVVDQLRWGFSSADTKPSSASGLRAIFLPPDGLDKRFDKMVLDIAHAGGGWRIGVMVDLKEGLWRALTKQDEHRTEMQADSIDTAIRQIGAFVQQWTPAP